MDGKISIVMEQTNDCKIPDLISYSYSDAITACCILENVEVTDVYSVKPYLIIIMKALGLLPERWWKTIPGNINILRVLRWNDGKLAQRDHNALCNLRDRFNAILSKYPTESAELLGAAIAPEAVES